jgi:hypothetical protein
MSILLIREAAIPHDFKTVKVRNSLVQSGYEMDKFVLAGKNAGWPCPADLAF